MVPPASDAAGIIIRLEALASPVEALLAHGADSTIRDPRHQATALAWAHYHKLERVAEVLHVYEAVA